jgi:hypothetical protein
MPNLLMQKEYMIVSWYILQETDRCGYYSRKSSDILIIQQDGAPPPHRLGCASVELINQYINTTSLPSPLKVPI